MERANAAQLASRNIKAAKGRRKTPIRSDALTQQSMPFQGGVGGGLFGGSVQAPNTFNFAPSGGPSFPPSNFGNNSFGNGSSPDVSENDDPRADTTGEEAMRRKRGFEQDPDSALQNSNPFNQANPFGQPQEKSAAAPFAFGQSQSTGSGMFNQAPAQATPNPFPFGATQPTPSSHGINFGAGPTQVRPTSNTFGGFGQQTTQPAAPVFNFGLTDKPATPQFPFSSSSMQPTDAGITFGAAPARENPAKNVFGTAAASSSLNTSNQFGSSGPTSNIFGNLGSKASSENMTYGVDMQKSASTNSTFGEQSQPAQNTGNVFGNMSQIPAKSLFENFQSTPGTSMFGGLRKPSETATNPFNGSTQQSASTSNIFGGLGKPKTQTNDLFGHLNKPLDQPVAQPKANGTASNGVSAETGESNTTGVSAPPLFSLAPSSNLSGTLNPPFSPSVTQSEAPAARSNSPFLFGSISTSAETDGKTPLSPLKPIDALTSANQPHPNEMFPGLSAKPLETSNTSTAFQNTTTVSAPSSSNGFMNGNATTDTNQCPTYSGPLLVPELSDEFLYPLAPAAFNEQQRQEFYTAYRLRSLNKVMAGYFSSIPATLEISSAVAHCLQKRMDILNRSSMISGSLKRRASEGENEENENPAKRNKQLEISGSIQSPDKPQASMSPQKSSVIHNQSQPVSNANAVPKAPSFTAPQLSSQGPAQFPTPNGKRKAETELTKADFEKDERESLRLNMNGGSTGSNTSNIFKKILDSPAIASPGKKVKAIPENSTEEPPRGNPVGSLHVPPSPATRTSPVASVTTNNIFAPKPTPVPATNNMFSPKPPTPSTEASSPKSTIKPPNFGSGNGPVNFLTQFGQKATKDTTKAEEKLMEEAKGLDDDFDSDDEEGWEARYKEKRKDQLKAAEAALEESKSKRASFIPGQGFSFVPTTPIPAPSDVGTNNSVFSSLNGSRTPTPSIFDKPSNNIFGHLASEPPSGKDDDTDDDSDNDSADEEADGDSENKDPTFQPDKENSSPGTPVEETGAGITSAKKANPFSLGPHKVGLFDPSRTGTPSVSGTSTPGSLFDRITKDANGNAMRQLPSDEKENTQPSTTTNIFSDIANPFSSSFSKTSDLPADQTWKKDSPIRFGSATTSNDTSNPKVSVTAATPTKASPFANLFGNSNTPKPALSSAGVGFSFGGASSNVSSLFPSAAVSASTSRATSPGGTTDGDSAAEGGDPDEEKHEQINLTAGGPGEEDEEVLFEVRAKATMFEDGNWQSRGLGPVRVLKHKETNSTRILLRADPSGKIILNKSLLAQNYKATAKTVKLVTAGEPGTLETWLLQVKTPESAEELVQILEANKPAT